MKTLHWLNALMGVWFILAPWILKFSGTSDALWTSLVVGAILLVVSVWAAAQEQARGWSLWQGWIALLAGIWFALMPYVVSVGGSAEAWTSTILGLIVILFSFVIMSKRS